MAPADLAPFGALLKRYRIAGALTQEELAERAHVSARAVSDLERGVRRTPYRDTLQRLGDALELSAADRAAFDTAARTTGDPALAPGGLTAAPPTGGYLGARPLNPLVAREAELTQLLSAAETVTQGEGRVVTLVGEPGIGKTRLAQELSGHLRAQGFLVATGRCYEPQGAVPYYPFLDALSAAYAAAPLTVRDAIPGRWPYLAWLFPDQLEMQASSGAPDEQQRLFSAVTGFFSAIAAVTPIALLIDDLHWADRASLDLFQHLARHTRGSRVLLLATYRDVEVQRQHSLRSVLHDLARERLVERIAIRRMRQEETTALLFTALGDKVLAGELTQLIHRHTEGNPFFTFEVLQALIERGDVHQRNGRWERRTIEGIVVPENVRDAIGERLSRLEVETQDLLRMASVLGQTFRFDDLELISGKGEEKVETALEEVMAAGLIREQGRDGYEFNHALIQHALYAELPARRRRKFHAVAAEALVKGLEHGRARPASELAWHFLKADDPVRALRYSLQACDEAMWICAFAELEIHARTALELAGEIGDDRGEGEAAALLAHVHYMAARFDEALAMAERALQHIDPEGDRAQLMEWVAGRVYTDQGELEQARKHAERVLRRADEVGAEQAVISTTQMLGFILLHQGDWADSRRYLEASLKRAIALPSNDHLWTGSGIAITLDDVAFMRIDLAKLSLAEGYWDEASEHLQRVLQTESLSIHSLLYARWLCAKLDLLEGRAEAALAHLTTLVDDDRLEDDLALEVLPVAVEIYLATGDVRRAEEMSARSVREAREHRHRLALLDALRVHGTALIEADRCHEATEVLEEDLTLARGVGHPYAEAQALHAFAALHIRQRERQQARERLEEALRIFQQLGAKPHVERIEQELAISQ